MKLTKISTQDLLNEIQRREDKELLEKYNTLPAIHLPYIEVQKIEHYHHTYMVDVFDGCEGFSYLINSHNELSDDELEDIVKHEALKNYDPNSEDWQIEDIKVSEVGRYNLTFLKVL